MKEFSQEAVNTEVNKMVESQKVPNILICGQTGVGKSSVVNFIFNDDVALTGTGAPCTKDITLYLNANINIYDSEGYEIGSEKQAHYEQLLFDFLKSHKGLDDKAVNLVWYAVSGAGKRYTDLDIKLIKRIKDEGFPVCALLTKIDEMDGDQLNDMMSGLQKDLNDADIFRLSILSKDNKEIAEYCDWDALIDWSYNHLSDVLRDRFVGSLREGLELKRKHANIAIGLATTAAAAVGASPIPFSDAALLVPIQTAMILRITSLYGIKLADGSITSLASSLIMTNLGKAAVGGLLKFIPIVGTIIGGVINASVASVLTGVLGKTLSELCYKQCKDSLEGKPKSFNIETILSSTSFISAVSDRFKKEKS